MATVSVLIPTYERPESLAMTLSGVAAQTVTDLQVVVSSQGRYTAQDSPIAEALGRVIAARGGSIEWHHRKARGIAEQRNFLLGCAEAGAALYLDDDVFMEPFVIGRLLSVLEAEGCGFVGAFPAGLTFLDDVRPDQQRIEPWRGPVKPEVVEKETPAWERWQLHRAANLHHVARNLDLSPGEFLRYKVAWVASCVLYSCEKRILFLGEASTLPQRRGCSGAEPTHAPLRRLRHRAFGHLPLPGTNDNLLPGRDRGRRCPGPIARARRALRATTLAGQRSNMSRAG